MSRRRVETNIERTDDLSKDNISNSATMDDLDKYLELLYEVPGKSHNKSSRKSQIEGTQGILDLCQTVLNLDQLIQNSTVMGALTRVLQEEYKKSAEVTFNIIRVFLALSNFDELQPLMADYKMGALTMKTIEYELKRVEIQTQELDAIEKEIRNREMVTGSDSPRLDSLQQDRLRARRKKRRHEKVLFAAFCTLMNLAENEAVERKMTRRSLLGDLVSVLDPDPALVHGLPVRSPLVVGLPDLLLAVLSFLRKLSVVGENTDALCAHGVAGRLGPMLTCSHPAITGAALRLLFNLSFHPEAREQMLRGGVAATSIMLLSTPAHRMRAVKLLYQLSQDDRVKALFAVRQERDSGSGSSGASTLVGLVAGFPQPLLSPELGALAANVSLHPTCAALMVTGRGLGKLMDRLTGSNTGSGSNADLDPLLLRLLRNLALGTFRRQESDQVLTQAPTDSTQSTDNDRDKDIKVRSKAVWAPHVKQLVQLAVQLGSKPDDSKSSDCLVEVLGCLGCLTVRDLPTSVSWARLLRDHGLLGLLVKLLAVKGSKALPDLQLEAVLVLSAAAHEPLACEVVASSGVVTALYQLYNEHAREAVTTGSSAPDTELMLQLLFLFYKLLQHEASCDELLYGTRIAADAIEALGHSHGAVRRAAGLVADLLLEQSQANDAGKPAGQLAQQMTQQILRARFESLHSHWLASVGDADPADNADPATAALVSETRPLDGEGSVRSRAGQSKASPARVAPNPPRRSYHFADELEE